MGTTETNTVGVTPGAGTFRTVVPITAAEQHDAHALHLCLSAYASLVAGTSPDALIVSALESELAGLTAWSSSNVPCRSS